MKSGPAGGRRTSTGVWLLPISGGLDPAAPRRRAEADTPAGAGAASSEKGGTSRRNRRRDSAGNADFMTVEELMAMELPEAPEPRRKRPQGRG